MYQWKEINLSPMKIFATYIRRPDNDITQVNGQFDCCDDEVRKFEDPIDTLGTIKKLEWVLVEKKNEDGGSLGFNSVTYKSSDASDILMAIECHYDDCPDDAQMLVYITEEFFVIVGINGSHPFVETPYVRYCNSDGSGPDIFEGTSLEDPDPQRFASNLVKYYHGFIRDKYH